MKIAVSISPANALRSGNDRTGWQLVEIEAASIPEDLRETMLTAGAYPDASYRGTAVPQACPLADLYLSALTVSNPTPESIIQALASLRSEREEKRSKELAEVEAKLAKAVARIEEWMALPVSEQVGTVWDNSSRTYRWAVKSHIPYDAPEGLLPAELIARHSQAVAQAEAEATRRKETEAREAAEAQAAREAAKQAAADRKHAQLADAVARLGDESQRERWAEGVLPTREAVDLIISEALAPLTAAGLTLLEDTDPVIDHTGEDADAYCQRGGEITTDQTVLTKLSATTYAAVKRVRAAAPKSATVEAVKVTAKCDACGARGSLVYLRASWTVGEIEVVAQLLATS